MSDEPPKSSRDSDSELEREVRAGREFTLAEAIGRLAGPGAMKGASPVDRRKQGAAEIEEYLCRHLKDDAGALSCVLLRHVAESERLIKDLDQPLAALAGCVRQLLGSECCLKELVREADVEWARVFGERPRFERDGCPPADDDPYTVDSVRAALTQLASGLGAGDGP